jgi:hypothetical protein
VKLGVGNAGGAATDARLAELALSARRAAKLERACAEHREGLITRDPTIGVSWDADRLELARLGVRPNARLLSTEAAKQQRYSVSTR